MKITKDDLEAAAFELRDLAALLNIYVDLKSFVGTSDLCLSVAEYLTETNEKDRQQIGRLAAECGKAIAEIEHYRQVKAELRSKSCSHHAYWALFKQNTRRILHAIARLSFAVDLFAVAYGTNYSRTVDTIQAQKRKMLDDLFDELNGIKKQADTKAADTNTDTASADITEV